MSGGFPVKILNIISIERHQYSNRIGASRFRFSKVKNILILHKKKSAIYDIDNKQQHVVSYVCVESYT